MNEKTKKGPAPAVAFSGTGKDEDKIEDENVRIMAWILRDLEEARRFNKECDGKNGETAGPLYFFNVFI
ncbi:MAG TPA: hypothetical protein PL090_06840 [Syntrophales bacterium]|nr:hypothetical protein [Syntrophales bacterium]